jgi:hypothetical protein
MTPQRLRWAPQNFMGPNLALCGLLEQPVSSDCGVHLLTRVHQQVTWVDLLTPSINSRIGG